MIKVELLNCPFCGNEPSQPEHIRKSGSGSIWKIECVWYCCRVFNGTKGGVVKFWNTRNATNPHADAEEEFTDAQFASVIERAKVPLEALAEKARETGNERTT